MLRYLTAGESHGQALVGILEGMPAGIQITEEYINFQLRRRQMGYGRGRRMEIEADSAKIISGVRFGKTTGSPISLLVENKDWKNWQETMKIQPEESQQKVTLPRPGHADLAGAIKYGHNDLRNIAERSSARETAMRVALCTIARKLLEEFGVSITSHVISIGNVKTKGWEVGKKISNSLADRSSVRCLEPEAEKKMIAEIEKAKNSGDSLGGVFEVLVEGLPIGLGSYVHWDRKLDGILAKALMSVQAIKGVEIGAGFEAAKRPGSRVHDEIFFEKGKYFRRTNNAGGIEGGMTNGEPVVIRAAMKPIPTLSKPLRSVDIHSKESKVARKERADVCAVPAASIVGEAVVAFAIADLFLEKFGGDSLREISKRVACQQRDSFL